MINPQTTCNSLRQDNFYATETCIPQGIKFMNIITMFLPDSQLNYMTYFPILSSFYLFILIFIILGGGLTEQSN